MRIIAILMMSAAVPWIGELIAVRSAMLRRMPFLELISGMLPDAAEQRLRHAGVASFAEALGDIALHSGIAREVARDEIGGLFIADSELLAPARTASVHRRCRSSPPSRGRADRA